MWTGFQIRRGCEKSVTSMAWQNQQNARIDQSKTAKDCSKVQKFLHLFMPDSPDSTLYIHQHRKELHNISFATALPVQAHWDQASDCTDTCDGVYYQVSQSQERSDSAKLSLRTAQFQWWWASVLQVLVPLQFFWTVRVDGPQLVCF